MTPTAASVCPGNRTTAIQPLAYRLRSSVSCRVADNAVRLVLAYPLKCLTLHRSWSAALRLMAAGEFVQLEGLRAAVGHGDPDPVEFFLDRLVEKGFLESVGVREPDPLPRVSIIVPVRNRPEDIAKCLESLLALDYPSEKREIIVVDDASTDHTARVVAGYPVHLLHSGSRAQAAACRNLGAHQAAGELLAFVDSDCRAAPLWLRELVPVFRDAALGAVGGLVDAVTGETGLDRYEQVKSSLHLGCRPKRSGPDDPFFYVPACNLLVRRRPFLRLGGFDPALTVGEDVDFCWRLQQEGWQTAYRPVGRVYHRHRNRPAAFCRRRFQYGTSEPLLRDLHPEKTKRMLLQPGCVLFWTAVAGCLASGAYLLPVLSVATSLAEAALRYSAARGAAIGFFPVFLAVLRGYLACAFHLCAFFSRYYLVWAVALCPIAPRLSAGIVLLHLVAGAGEWVLRRPRLSPIGFLACFTLEQLSYQCGVWYESFRRRSFNPVNPVIVTRRDP